MAHRRDLLHRLMAIKCIHALPRFDTHFHLFSGCTTTSYKNKDLKKSVQPVCSSETGECITMIRPTVMNQNFSSLFSSLWFSREILSVFSANSTKSFLIGLDLLPSFICPRLYVFICLIAGYHSFHCLSWLYIVFLSLSYGWLKVSMIWDGNGKEPEGIMVSNWYIAENQHLSAEIFQTCYLSSPQRE